jgi:nanoRNase/pAp phosphatase (c-di-AMP/oligoRNAs hydrolase)
LLTGIITDTLGFRTSNITPEALRQAATLMETGVDMPEIYMRSLVRKSFPPRVIGARGFQLAEQEWHCVGTLTVQTAPQAMEAMMMWT